MYDDDNVFTSKVSEMNHEFAYLCDGFPNNSMHSLEHYMSIFDNNSFKIESFNLGTNDNPKNILIASNVTHNREI